MIPNFESFISQLTEGISVQSFSGFAATGHKNLNQDTTLVSSLMISPSYMPKQNKLSTIPPCSYAFYVNGHIDDMPFSISTSNDQLILLNLTIPLTKHSDIGFIGVVDDFSQILFPNIGATMKYSGKNHTFTFATDITEKYRTASFNFFSTFFPTQRIGIGTALSLPFTVLNQKMSPRLRIGLLNDRTKLISINEKINDPNNLLQKLYYHETNKQYYEGSKYSLQIQLSDSMSLQLAHVYTVQPKTTAGLSFSVTIPLSEHRTFQSECQMGFQRTFLLGSVSASLTSHGTLQSIFTRNIKDGFLVNVSGSANFPTKIHSFGLGVILQ